MSENFAGDNNERLKRASAASEIIGSKVIALKRHWTTELLMGLSLMLVGTILFWLFSVGVGTYIVLAIFPEGAAANLPTIFLFIAIPSLIFGFFFLASSMYELFHTRSRTKHFKEILATLEEFMHNPLSAASQEMTEEIDHIIDEAARPPERKWYEEM